MPLLSIIVPVYKVEKYLHECIDSILAQTFTDFELILVDDGSPDRCGEICDEYAAKDTRVNVIHQENCGAAAARNLGITSAKGEYLAFVDSDDKLVPHMYEQLVHKMEEGDLDLCICGIELFDRIPPNVKKTYEHFGEIVLTAHDFFGQFYKFHGRTINGPCNKTYVTKIIKENSILFPEAIRNGEDLLFNLQYFKYCHLIQFVPENLYLYRYLPNSQSHTFLKDQINYQWQLYAAKHRCLYEQQALNKENTNALNEDLLRNMFKAFEDVVRFEVSPKNSEQIMKECIMVDEFQSALMSVRNVAGYNRVLVCIAKTKNVFFIYWLIRVKCILKKLLGYR